MTDWITPGRYRAAYARTRAWLEQPELDGWLGGDGGENRLGNGFRRRLVVDGRRELDKWAVTLHAIERRYGVPRAIIVALWGRESGFGSAPLTRDAVRTLATEAYLGFRKDVFEPELIAALQILARGDVDRSQLKSSWAGALGQPQLLPSQFLRYAVDFEGNGHRDIWHSVPDSLASIANDLAQQGWKTGREWGFEVEIPEAVSCAAEGREKGKAVAEGEASD